MLSTKVIGALVLCAFSASLGAQTTITNTVPAVVGFVDLPTNGGTPVTPPPGDDTMHNFVTTVGNSLFPAGNVRLSNNGVMMSGATTGTVPFSNIPISPNLTFSGAATICAFWDDLVADPAVVPPTSVQWKEELGVLYILWKDEYRFGQFNALTITFEVQVFSTPAPGAPLIQILYPDTTFGGLVAGANHGLSATVGYVKGTSNPVGTNVQWGFNTASVPDGTVLSIFDPMTLAASSPLGPGSIRLDFISGPPNGTYVFAATLTPGAFPNGWLFGLDISYAELGAQLASGFPFTGSLNASGNFSLGPISNVPPLTIYAIAFGIPPGSPVPTEHTLAISHTIP